MLSKGGKALVVCTVSILDKNCKQCCCVSLQPHMLFLQLALLALETRTAFTADDSHHTLSSKTADAFAAAISDGLTGLAALPSGDCSTIQQNNTLTAGVPNSRTAGRVSRSAAAPDIPDEAAGLLLTSAQGHEALSARAAAQQGASAMSGVDGGDSPHLQAAHGAQSTAQQHGSDGAATPHKILRAGAQQAIGQTKGARLQHGPKATAGRDAGFRTPGKHASGPERGSELGAFLLGICTGLQSLQSLAARDRAFQLAPQSVARMAHLPWQLLQARSALPAPTWTQPAFTADHARHI